MYIEVPGAGFQLPQFTCTQPEGFELALNQECVSNLLAETFCGILGWNEICQDAYLACAMGCTNPEASNFDPTAETDDGSCILPMWYIPWDSDAIMVFGFTSPANYYLANQSCAEETEALFGLIPWNECGASYNCCAGGGLGCTDYTAENYAPNACFDDGSCDYVDTSCPGDLNFDGAVGSLDILVLLGQFGTLCPQD